MIKIGMKVFVPIVILYLIVSSIYCSIHIDFRGRPQITSPGYSRETNLIRSFMGLPSTATTYEGVPPIYLLQVVIKMVIALILLLWYPKLNEKIKKKWMITIWVCILICILLITGLQLVVANNSRSYNNYLEIAMLQK